MSTMTSPHASDRRSTPMLSRLGLRIQLLLGYGAVMVLTIIFAVLLFQRIGLISRQVDQLGQNAATDIRLGTEAIITIGNAQRAVDRYLQQPNETTYQTSVTQLEQLQQTIARLQTNARNPALRDHLQRIDGLIETYAGTFTTISASMAGQEQLRQELDSSFLNQYQTIETAIAYARPRTQNEFDALENLRRAGSRLQQAFVWVNRIPTGDSELATNSALNALQDARDQLRRYLVLSGASGVVRPEDLANLNDIVGAIDLSLDQVRLLSENYQQSIELVEQQLKPQANLINNEATVLSDTALLALSITVSRLEQDTTQTQTVGGGILAGIILAALLLGLALAAIITRPLRDLVVATERLTHGSGDSTVQPRGGRELVALAQAFNTLSAALANERAHVRRQNELLAERAGELEATLQHLHAEADARAQLDATIREMSVPIIPVMRGIIIAPLVGEIDAARADMLQRRLLEQVAAERAQVAILDITGVPIVDTQISAWLMEAMRATRLLGARCVLVGISPEVAQALVSSGVQVNDAPTRATLREGLEYAMKLVR